MKIKGNICLIGLLLVCGAIASAQQAEDTDKARLVVLAHTKELTKSDQELLKMTSIKEVESAIAKMKAMCWNEEGILLVADSNALGLEEAKGKMEALRAIMSALQDKKEVFSIDNLPDAAKKAVLKSLSLLVPSRIPLEGQNRKVGIVPSLSLRLKNGDKTVNVSYTLGPSSEANEQIMQSPPDPNTTKSNPSKAPKKDSTPKTSLIYDWRETSILEADILEKISKLSQLIADEKRKIETQLSDLGSVMAQALSALHPKEMGGDAPLLGSKVNALPAEAQELIELNLRAVAANYGLKSDEEVRQFLLGAEVDSSLQTVSLMIGVLEGGVKSLYGVPFHSVRRSRK